MDAVKHSRRRALHWTEAHRPVFAASSEQAIKTMMCIICGRTARRADAWSLMDRGAVVFMDAAQPKKEKSE